MAGSAAIPLPTQRFLDDEPLLEPLEIFDFDAFFAAQTRTDIPLSNHYVALQEIGCYTAPPHNPSAPITYSPVADTLPIINPESWSREVGYHTNDPNYLNGQFQGAFFDENTRQYPAILGRTLGIIPSTATYRTDAMKVNGARRQPITPVVNLTQRTGTRAPTPEPILYPDLMTASLRLSGPQYGQSTGFSSSPSDVFSKFQSRQVSQVFQNHHHAFPLQDNGGFGLLMDPLGFSPTSLYGSTGGLDQFPEQHYNGYTPHLPSPEQGSPYSNVRIERSWVDSIPVPPYPPRLLRDEDMSALKYVTHDDFSSSAQYGRDIPRTSSPASYDANQFHFHYGKVATRSTGFGATGSGATGSGSTRSGSTGSGTTGSGSSSSEFSFARSSRKLLDQKEVLKKPRKLTELGKQEYRYTRINGACVGCHLRRKRVSSTPLLRLQAFIFLTNSSAPRLSKSHA
jgi:hypothetical protein